MKRPRATGTRPGTGRGLLAATSVATATLLPLVSCAGSDTGDLQTFCVQVQRVPVVNGPDDLTVPDTATATAALVTELRRLREASPPDIRGDVSVLVGVTEDLAVALSERDEATVEAARQRVTKAREAWKAASDNVVVFTAARCQIDLGTTG